MNLYSHLREKTHYHFCGTINIWSTEKITCRRSPWWYLLM